MSLAAPRATTNDARALVVEALSGIEGIIPTRTIPDAPTAGAAWPVWVETTYTSGKLTRPITHTYEVRVVLPAGWFPDTVDTADGLVEQVAAALSTVGIFENARPAQIAFEQGQTMPGINARVTVIQR